VNRAVVQAIGAQPFDHLWSHAGRGQREFFGILTQHPVQRAEFRRAPVPRNRMDIGIGCGFGGKPIDLSPEVMRVRLRSVFAVVGLADHHGQHFALCP
jgi:hypothetical protein